MKMQLAKKKEQERIGVLAAKLVGSRPGGVLESLAVAGWAVASEEDELRISAK
jgi:hypothetical protein